jgi:hypothetical protein
MQTFLPNGPSLKATITPEIDIIHSKARSIADLMIIVGLPLPSCYKLENADAACRLASFSNQTPAVPYSGR